MTTYSNQRIALAAAAAVSVVFTACSLTYALAPAFAMTWMGALYHMPMTQIQLSWSSFLMGLVGWALAGYLVGYLFAVFLDFGRNQTN